MLTRILLTTVILLSSAPAHAQLWPNEPAGSTVVLDCPFSQQMTTQPVTVCAVNNVYNAGAIVSDSDPVSPPGAYRSRISAGQQTGGTQLNWVYPQTVNEMYMGMVVRTNPEFQGRTTANKTFFLRGPGMNGFWGLGGAVGSTGGPMYFGHNTSSLDNSHACAFDLGLVCNPNVASPFLIKGQWTKLEAYVKKSSTATSRDGIVRWWVNGILSGNYTNLNYAQNGLNEWVWSETWDGTVTNPVPSVPWEWYLGHLHIAIPNCGGCPVTGGGGTTPPPPPQTLPPLGVGNLRFGS